VEALDELMTVSPWAKEKENFSVSDPTIERRQTMVVDVKKLS
jgi:hypothetical protein